MIIVFLVVRVYFPGPTWGVSIELLVVGLRSLLGDLASTIKPFPIISEVGLLGRPFSI